MNKIIGLALIGLGIFLEVMWLGFVFGSVVIGVLLLIFAPRVLFFPFNFFLVMGVRLIYAKAFKEFESARAKGSQYNYSYQQDRVSTNQIQAYYAELECSVGDDMSVVKKSYRRLMKEHHYDSLVSKGLPQDMLKYAEEKSKRLNEAYATIKEQA